MVSVLNPKTYVSCSFTIMKKRFSVSELDVCRKYVYKFRNKKCIVQSVVINSLSKIPEIADFFKFTELESYTGHSLRPTSSSLLPNAGGDFPMVQHHSRWKSTTVPKGYAKESISSKMTKKILGIN